MNKTIKLTDLTVEQVVDFQKALSPVSTATTLRGNRLPNAVRKMFIDAWSKALEGNVTMSAEEQANLNKKIELFTSQMIETRDVVKVSPWGKVVNATKNTGKFVQNVGTFAKDHWVILLYGTVAVAVIIARVMSERDRETYTVHFRVEQD
jgi:hypothetical protein